jgi:hypothetical protein
LEKKKINNPGIPGYIVVSPHHDIVSFSPGGNLNWRRIEGESKKVGKD